MAEKPYGDSIVEVFARGQKIALQLEKTTLEPQSQEYKDLVAEGVAMLKRALQLIDSESIFSKNEEMADVPTNSLKYLLVPFYLGRVYLKPFSAPERYDAVTNAKLLLNNFLQNCVNLGVMTKQDIATFEREGKETAEERRNEKIERANREKKAEKLLRDILTLKVKRSRKGQDEGDDDEELERQQAKTLIEIAIGKALDEFVVIQQELEILEFMRLRIKEGKPLPKSEPNHKAPPFKTFKIDSRAQAQDIFNAHWRLPTKTLEELAEEEIADMRRREAKDKIAEEKEKKRLEELGSDEDEDQLKKDREWDAWKDDHPWGEGNTGTKGYSY